jgi:hypothetical protein
MLPSCRSCSDLDLTPRYQDRCSVGSGFVALGSVGGVSLKPDRADFGTSTAQPAINMLAATTAAIVLMLPMIASLLAKG